MTQSFDIVIRGGLIVDGTGAAPYKGDVAIRDGRIAAVGEIDGVGVEEIDADGRLVTPGFVDIHTHYDGHVTWGSRLNPSSAHGVTTVVMGNCGVGFAPCREGDREKLIQLMEGVEDIPGVVMTTGIPWNWESFPEYLDALAVRSYDMDIAAQLPHAALRVNVMGDRAVARAEATPEDIEQMAAITKDAIKAGALGFSTSRSINHKAVDGTITPSYAASERELVGIANAVADCGTGVLQMISDFDDEDAEFDVLRSMASSGRPLSMSLMQFGHVPQRWTNLLGKISEANADGLKVKAQVIGRPVGALIGLELSFNPFCFCPSYREIAHLGLSDRVAAMKDPARRAKIISEFPCTSFEPIAPQLSRLENMFVMGAVPDYEPAPDTSIAAQAEKLGKSAPDHAYDLLIENDGKNVIYIPAANYVDYKLDAAATMLSDDHTILGLGDGGAHCGIVCDASAPTYMLTRWVDESRHGSMPIERAVKKLTSDTANAVNLRDRGVLKPGYKADVNIVDPRELKLYRPEMIYDLPEGGGRLHQRAGGYDATIVSGVVTYRKGVATGALPGRLVRGEQRV